MVYRPSYDNELNWLNRVEATINDLRDPNHLRPDEYQAQLEMLIVSQNKRRNFMVNDYELFFS